MANKLEILQELDRRGKLPEHMLENYKEAQRRGLIDSFMGPPQKPYRGGVLPFSIDETGKKSLDFSAGIPGLVGDVAKSAWGMATAPGDAATGKLDVGPPGRPSLAPDETYGRALEAAIWASPVTPAARFGSRLMSAKPEKIKPPTGEALRKAGAQGFDDVADMDVVYKSQSVKDMADKLRAALDKEGLIGEIAPTSNRIVDMLRKPPEGSAISTTGLRAAKNALREARKNFNNPSEKRAAEQIIRALDDFIEKPSPKNVLSGPADAAAKAHQAARGNYAAGKRSGTITGEIESAQLSAAVANSGQNLGNALRQRAKAIVDPKFPKRQFGFSKEEIAALEKVARGTATENTLRSVGNLLGGGGGLGAGFTGSMAGAAGYSVGGYPGAVAAGLVVPTVGKIAKKTSAGMSKRALNAADELIRSRSPLYNEMLANAPMVAPSAALRSAPLRSGAAATLQNMQKPEIDPVTLYMIQRVMANGR